MVLRALVDDPLAHQLLPLVDEIEGDAQAATTVTRMEERNQSSTALITGSRGTTWMRYVPVSGTSTNASQCEAQ